MFVKSDKACIHNAVACHVEDGLHLVEFRAPRDSHAVQKVVGRRLFPCVQNKVGAKVAWTGTCDAKVSQGQDIASLAAHKVRGSRTVPVAARNVACVHAGPCGSAWHMHVQKGRVVCIVDTSPASGSQHHKGKAGYCLCVIIAIIAAIVPFRTFRLKGKLYLAHVQNIVLVPEIGCRKALRQKAFSCKVLKRHIWSRSRASFCQKFRLVQAGIALESLRDQAQVAGCRGLFHPDASPLNDTCEKGQHETCDKDGAKDFHQGKARLACSCPCSGHCPP